MNLTEYKETIKKLVDSTDNETLLMHWKNQLEWDVKHQDKVGLSDEEMSLVQEGIDEYEKGEVISFEEFISKRK